MVAFLQLYKLAKNILDIYNKLSNVIKNMKYTLIAVSNDILGCVDNSFKISCHNPVLISLLYCSVNNIWWATHTDWVDFPKRLIEFEEPVAQFKNDPNDVITLRLDAFWK